MLLFIRELEIFNHGAGELLRTLGSVPSVLQPSRTPIPGAQCPLMASLGTACTQYRQSSHPHKIKNNFKNKLHDFIQKILSVGIWTYALEWKYSLAFLQVNMVIYLII